MISCQTDNGIEHITRFEHFRDIIPEEIYSALEAWMSKEELKYEEITREIKWELSCVEEAAEAYASRSDNLENELSNIKISIKYLCEKIQDAIDWKYDSYSGYQDMMVGINELVEQINKVVD